MKTHLRILFDKDPDTNAVLDGLDDDTLDRVISKEVKRQFGSVGDQMQRILQHCAEVNVTSLEVW